MPPDTSPATPPQEALGPNAWLVDEMYEQYRADPSSVSESWREFFADYQSDTQAGTTAGRRGPAGHRAQGRRRGRLPPGRRAAPRRRDRSRRPRPRPRATGAEALQPLRGAAARIVANMEASLQVPTATSFREVPAKLLEVNRKVVNGYLGRTRGGKISFTHLIGYAVVRAIADSIPVMNSSFVTDERRQAGRDPPRAREPGPGRRRREEGRQPHAAGAGDPRRRHPRLPGLLGRLRGADPQGPQQQALARRLRRRHRHPHQPRHDRHRAVGAPAHARPGRDRRRRPPRRTRPPSRAPTPRRSPTSASRR